MMPFVTRRKFKEVEAEYKNQLDAIKCRIDLDPALPDAFDGIRHSAGYQAAFDNDNPLISICIATYNRAELLTKRTLPSMINQTYNNIEIIVVGDCCTDSTPQDVAALGDERIRFVNLDKRGEYPTTQYHRWMVAGTKPANHALSIARGDFITHCDDDDRFVENRIEKLLSYAQQKRAELVWHPFYSQREDGTWKLSKSNEFSQGFITTSSVFYHNWFKCIGWDVDAWRFKEPGDWNRFRKFKFLNINAHFFPEPMLYHYREKTQNSD